ncbi:hypothetical protein HWV62_644 [Athelia sp. TMB]|nr:hypothetical protein HWV62_4275 [Athelia sp. TMB]KAF7978450.1 hypothetical protein HWV62_644 [Athelia sp. TMB]
MKFFSTAILASVFATAAYAQGVVIAAPPASSTVKPGQSLKVQINRPDSLSGSTEVAVVIGMIGCTASSCPGPDEELGHILYNGLYRPKLHGTTLEETFTVTVPSTLTAGKAVLSVSHFTLIGAGPIPYLQLQNITLTVA